MKCLEKAPHRRFESAKLLADELRRFLDGKPTLTRPISRVSRVWRWSRRHPALSGMLAASVLLAMTLAVSTFLIANQRDIAEDRLVRATTAERQAKSALDESATAREETRRLLYVSDMNAATQAWETSNIARTLGLLNRHRPEQNQVDLRGFEWYHLWRLCYSSLSTPNIKHTEAVAALAFSPDGTKVATGSGNTVQIWNVGTRMREHTFEPHQGVVLCVAFSPDGKILATGSADKTVRLWSVDTRESLHVLDHQQGVVSVSFSRTGLLASSDHTVGLWDVSTGNPLGNLEGASSAFSVAFSPTDGRTLATADRLGSTTFWDVEKRQSDSKEGSTGHGVCVTFSSDGTLVATADADSMIRLWDVATHTQLAVFRGHSAEVMSVVFSPDGKRLASASVDSTVRLWDVESEQCSRIFRGHIGSVRVVAFSPDGKTLASGGLDSSLRLWDVIANPKNPDTLSGHNGIITQVSLSPDARTLASRSTDSQLRLWDLALGSGESGEDVHLTTQTLKDAKFSPRGSLLALADDVNVRIRSVTSNNDVVILPEAKANCVAFSPNGNILATGSSQENSVTLWDTETWQPIRTFDDYCGLGFAGRGLVFSSHGDLIAISGSDNTVSLWTISANLTESNLQGRLKGHTDIIVCLAFSPNGQTLATGSFDGTVRLWDVETHKSYSLRASNGEVWSLAFSPDGKTLATSSGNVVQLWNVATKGQVANLNGHASKVSCVLFSADGKMLVSGSFDKTIKVWRASTEHDVLNAVWMNNIQLPQQSIRRLTPYGNYYLNRQDADSR